MDRQHVHTLIRRALPRPLYSALKVLLRITYNSDGIITSHVCDFLNDPKFRSAYERGHSLGCWGFEPIEYRAYICCWAASRAAQLPGDFVECGVWRGGLARVVTSYVEFQKLPKTFYLLDTFEGIDLHHLNTAEAQHHAKVLNRSYYSKKNPTNSYESVRASFADLPNVTLIKGSIPDTLARVPARQVSYLSIDMNNAVPEIAAAEFFWPKIVSGGIIVLDDYACAEQYREQRLAFDRFAREREIQVLSLPTGQGLIFKP